MGEEMMKDDENRPEYGLPRLTTAPKNSFATEGDNLTEDKDEDEDEDVDEDKNYPQDCMSFFALGPKGGPDKNNIIPMLYAGLVIAFQFFFLYLMILSRMVKDWNTEIDIDNPNKEFRWGVAHFLPADVPSIVRATQIASLLAFVLFPEESLFDFGKNVVFFPRKENENTPKERREENIHCARIASILQGLQGLLACLTIIILVMTSTDVIDIILNFSAVNFISSFDETAFELASSGKYGPKLKRAAKHIERKPLTDCRKPENARYFQKREKVGAPEEGKYSAKCLHWCGSVFLVGLILLVLGISVVQYQSNNKKWRTHMFRVQFDEETGLERYSGCYRYERGNYFIESDGRLVYSNKDEAQETAVLGYCHADRTWVFVNYNESDPNQDFCDSTKGEIAHSEKTNSYDFSSAFEIGWKSPFNKPLDVYFIDNPGNKNGDNGFFECDSIANDGKCDKALNNFDYKYDGGDCCATTCTHADCHPEEANQAFGEDTPGAKQFPSCIDPDMVDLTIYLTRYNSKGIPEWARNSNYNDLEEWKSNWKPPSLLLECNGNVVFSVPVNPILSDITEPSEQSPSIIAKVEPDAICNLNISNFLTVWDINVEVNDDRVTTNTLSSSIPSEIGRLTNLMALNMGNQSLAGTIPVNITHLHLEELDLHMNSIHGTIPYNIDSLKNLTKLRLDFNTLTGSIPNRLQSLEKLFHLDLSSNKLSGIIPNEIGELTNLAYLSLGQNSLTGEIPTEIGSLKHLLFLDLSGNNLCGSVSCTNFKEMDATELELCRERNTFKPCLTPSPSISASPTNSNAPSAVPTISPAPSVTQNRRTSPAPTGLSSDSSSDRSEICDSIVDVICGEDRNLTSLCGFLSDEIEQELSIGNWTVFAPLNDIPENVTIVEEEDITDLAWFHIFEEVLTKEDLPCDNEGDNTTLITMANGRYTRIKCDDDIPIGQKGRGNNGTISNFIEFDIEACNGMIHIIENVLLP